LNYNVCFTPKQRCEPLILNHIRNAKYEILTQAYSFTSKPIANELIRAKNRNVNVQLIADKSQKKTKYSQIRFLKQNAIPVYIDHKPAIAHNKIIIIDGQYVVTGSYNFSHAAEHKNAENIIILNNKKIANQYKQNWLSRKSQSSNF
jgi:phosphatidylserine/phosphatidylglycerophosphate/cardiolipin synthase-like enzyme